MKPKQKIPNFFIAGAARSGTTTLYFKLSQHPNIYMSNGKEPRFFTSDWGVGGVTSWDEYIENFDGHSDEKIIGEASADYLYSRDAAENISESVKNPKVLIQLRHPLDRSISEYKLRRRTGEESCHNFLKAISKEKQRMSNGATANLHYLNKSKYYKQVKRFKEKVGPKNVMVTLFENFVERPHDIIDNICCFLNISKFEPSEVKRYNASNELKYEWIEQFLKSETMYKKVVKKIFESVLTPNTYSNLIRKIRSDWNISSDQISVSVTPKERKKIIRKCFVEEIKKLDKLIGKDVTNKWQ